MRQPATLLFIIVLLSAVTVHAQPRIGFGDSPSISALVEPHRILIKLVSPSAMSPSEQAERILARLANEYGSITARPWLRPELTGGSGGGLHKVSTTGLARIVSVEFSADADPRLVASKIAALPGVEYAEPVFRRTVFFTPNDPFLAQQAYLEQVKALDGWSVGRADSSVIVAIIDTGVDWLHPDLASAMWHNPGETGTDASGADRATNGRDDDGNGLIDDWIGWDFAGQNGRLPDNDPMAAYWHGTHVAGIAAAVGNNGVGVAGVGYGARIMALKISDEDRQQPNLIGGFDAMLYAARMGARVINCSWGGQGRSDAEQEVIDAVTAAGALVVSAAGNDGRQTTSYPAAYRNVLSVASVRAGDRRSVFSSYNSSVGISAPGDEIFSTLPRSSSSGGYGYASGTSMASPVVAGAAAVVATRFPSLDPGQIAAVLRATADDVDSINPEAALLLGSGRLNMRRAMEMGDQAVMADLLDVSVVDESGDGQVDPGERFELRAHVRNLLRSVDSLAVDIELLSPSGAQVLSSTAPLGRLVTGESRSTPTGSLALVAPASTPLDYALPVRLTMRNGTNVVARQRLSVLINPNFGTTRTPRLAVTFTGNGRIGYSDFPDNTTGVGFRVDSTSSLLAEAGLLIGTGPSHLADVVRGSEPGYQNQGLQTISPYRARWSEGAQAEIGMAVFNDQHLYAMQRVGVEVSMRTIAPAAADRNREIVVLYSIRNTSGSVLDPLYCALYLDWDLGPGGAGNRAVLDPENRLGYVANEIAPGYPTVGTMLVSGEPMDFDALDNAGPAVGGGFYQAEKWQSISGGIRSVESSVGDCSMIVGAGPLRLAAGADTTIAFALLAGGSLDEVRAAAEQAREIVAREGLRPGSALDLPRAVGLEVAAPNPFVSSTTISVRIPNEGPMQLDVFDAMGRLVAELAGGVYTRGEHRFVFAPDGSADQVYFVRLMAGGKTILRKVVRLARN